MFDYNKMIKRAIEFFPTWSDIRKRYKTSAGGKLLSSVTEEVMELEQAIKEYKRYYFLDSYEGHEDEVMAFSYMAPIGIIESIDSLVIEYNDKELDVTEDINRLLNYEEIVYYENGYIYINEKIFTTKNINIYVDGFLITEELTKTHIWNIFDEFACFVGLERHENEKNSELVKRILHINRYKPNATIEGLQNAIMAELLTEFPDIARDEIKFEQVNDENLRKGYDTFNTLLDYLNSINCDVYRWKRWDLNVWKNDFKSISYIPQVWDQSISNFTNGVGYGDDCSVSISSNTQETDAVITLYNKSKETMNKYLADKNIEKNIKMQFKKYNDILSSNDVNYTIKASQLSRLNPEQIKLDVYQQASSKLDISLEKLFFHGHDISVNSTNSRLNDVYPYRLKFESKNNNQEIKITKCMVHYTDKTTGESLKTIDLLKEKIGFSFNALGNLVSNSIKKSITKVEDFDHNQYNYFENMPDGSGMKMTGVVGTGVKSLYNLGGQSVSCSSSCEMSALLPESKAITFNSAHCVWYQNNVKFIPNDVLKKINIKIVANKFSFDVLTNNQVDVLVRYSTEGNYSIIDKANYGTTWSTQEFSEPRYMEIVITSRVNEEAMVGNFKYSNYSIEFAYRINDSFIKMNNNVLPISNNIKLRITVKSNSGGCPIIHGIYIGTGVKNTVYVTDSFDILNNAYRELEIESNCRVTLIRRDINDTRDVHYQEDFNPAVSYTAKSNDAYIRLDLSDYTQINNITVPVGNIETVEESGVIYYNLALTEGQEAQYITIDGIRNEAAYSTTLLDIINKELSNYNFNITTDRVYCCPLVKGVIIIKNGDEGNAEILSLNSSLFAGIDSTKYVFSEIPSNIGVIWGVGEGFYSDSITGSFEYISFYSSESKVHVANNTYNLFVNEIKDVPIAENFTHPESYNKNNLNFYTVTSNTANTSIRFYNYLDENKQFNELLDWTVGIKGLYIKDTNNYNNESIYDINTIDYQDKKILAEYINIEDQYKISNNNTINTEQYIVIPPEGMTVRYKEYDGTEDTKDLVKTESFYIDETMFKKLKYSNIDKVLYIGTSAISNSNVSDSSLKYTMLNTEGILIWNEKTLAKGAIVYIQYTIKKPVALVFDLEALYKLTGYTVETYRELSSYYLPGMSNGSTYDLRKFADYPESDLAYIQCSEPSFEGQMIDEYTVKFNKHIEEKSVMVKTGYYYFNGREYYLFSEDESKTLYNNKHMLYENVDISDDYIFTYKATNNFVRNSEMLLRNLNDLYYYDCDTPIESPKFNKFTACDSYNDWITFNTDLDLSDELYKFRIENNDETLEGFNNVALKLKKKETGMTNYAYINITEYVSEITYLTLAATQDLKIYIGEEQKLGNLKLRTSLSVKVIEELKSLTKDSCVRTINFNAKENTKYYLIVEGEGLIDDIIISDSLKDTVNYHVKNIEKFGLFFKERKTEGTLYKLRLDNNYSSISNNASICSDGYIRLVGDVTWNATKIKEYSTREDFENKNCFKDTELIIGDYIKAPKTSTGRFMTDYIEIDPRIINRLFVKVNDVLLDNMDNFKITILSVGDKRQTDYEVVHANNNYAYAYGDELYRYVRFLIEIPEGHIVDKIEILAEYKSEKGIAPKLSVPSVGSLISPVYDSQESLIYDVKNINIKDLSNMNDVEVYIRTLQENNTAGIWSDWNEIKMIEKNDRIILDDENEFTFEYKPVRFFQFKVVLKSRSAYICLDSIDIEVKE
jgi:hypothetical protein